MPTYEWSAAVSSRLEGGRVGRGIQSGAFEIGSPSHDAAVRKMYDDLERRGYTEEFVRDFDLAKIDDEPC
jgi:hypothetical protein